MTRKPSYGAVFIDLVLGGLILLGLAAMIWQARFRTPPETGEQGECSDSLHESGPWLHPREMQSATASYRVEQLRTAGGTEFDLCPPPGLASGSRYPLVLFLSPTAVTEIYLPNGVLACQAQGCFYAASYHFRNDVSHRVFVPQVVEVLEHLLNTYPIDPGRVFLAGMSGGGQGCGVVPYFAPGRVRGALVCNGALHPNLQPPGELARTGLAAFVLLSGDQDDVVTPATIRGDEDIIRQAGIPVRVIPFPGGHEIAPVPVWEDGLRWLLATCPPTAGTGDATGASTATPLPETRDERQEDFEKGSAGPQSR